MTRSSLAQAAAIIVRSVADLDHLISLLEADGRQTRLVAGIREHKPAVLEGVAKPDAALWLRGKL